MHTIQSKIFKYKNFTPLVFLVLMFLYRWPNIFSLTIGLVVVFFGEIIRLWGISYYYSGNQTIKSAMASENTFENTSFVTIGPFAYVRNPLYLGNIFLYSGISIMSFALFPFLQIAVLIFFYWQYSFIIREEEDLLKRKLGEDFGAYFHSVPGLIPRITAFSSNPIQKFSSQQHSFNLKSAFSHESNNIKAYCFLSLTFIIIWFIGRF